MKSVTIISNDKIGLLADISYVLSKSKINIESVAVDVVAGKAIINLMLSDADKGKNALVKSGYEIEEANTVVIKLKDEPGQLNHITGMLSKGGINIQNLQILSRSEAETVLSLKVDKPKKAEGMLKEFILKPK